MGVKKAKRKRITWYADEYRAATNALIIALDDLDKAMQRLRSAVLRIC